MFHKFALAFKTKTIELFANDDVDGGTAPEEAVITGQRVVVIKPDQPPGHIKLQKLHATVGALFATAASFKAAYHQLQAAHAPLDAAAAESADRAAVSHLARLSDFKRAYVGKLPVALPSQLEAEVQENQSLLRTFDMAVNRLQSEIDGKYAQAYRLKQELRELRAVNAKMEDKLNDLESSPELLLTVGLFRSVLLDVCRSAHGFTGTLVQAMKNSGCDLDSAADLLYPGIDYSKAGHSKFALLACVCSEVFSGFSSQSFDESSESSSLHSQKRRSFLMQFVEHGSVDALELLEQDPDCEFARFCEGKWRKLAGSVSSLSTSPLSSSCPVGGEELSSWRSASPPLYEAFVNMASLVWMLHKLAFAFEPPVRVFGVERGAEFSAVFMEPVAAQRGSMAESGKVAAKVGFCVIPGFYVGKTAIQCQVYLDGLNTGGTAQKIGGS